MHIIIIGCGKVGAKFAKVLSEDGHDVVIVDNDYNAFKALGGNFNGITVTGVPIDQDVLKQAGIETADALAAVTPDDNVNIMVSQVAKEIFKVPKVIARIFNPEREHVFHEFGLETICPTDLTVDMIYSRIVPDGSTVGFSINKLDFLFRNERVPKNFEGKKLGAVKLEENETVFGIIKNNNFEFADRDTLLEKDDILIIAQKG